MAHTVASEISRWFLALFFPTVAAFYTVRILVIGRHRGRRNPDAPAPYS